jgi:adenosylcobinamide-GDP ribazoletransferase
MPEEILHKRAGLGERARAVGSDLGSALRATTIVLGGAEPAVPGTWVVYYPLIGLAMGGAMAAAAALGGGGFGSLAALALATALSGARPVAGLSRTLVSLAPKRSLSPIARLHGARRPAVVAGAAAILLLELFCLVHLDRLRSIGLLFAPMLGRCAMVVLAVGSRQARADGRRTKLAPAIGFNHFAVASTLTFAVVFLVAEFLGLLLVLACAALTIGLRVFFHWWFGGVERTTLAAGCEAVQLLVLALLAAF